ncbi:hypothetical protein DFJ58DRAFT_824554 [Suillus subalutaceus]|uniref:uncharacterized protein n=1 Tax=Suillus subalutaceus TaxID=48586 RepID=UPI001B87C1B4|nr:uncharacterized protein DFJ58DRAFT_824554 [Suillus subalutaceus]KAG1830681.1 hypothetical protein DFJ58DRAFT_824554 [Suillus subalutaceus]
MVCWPCGQTISDYNPRFHLHQNQQVRKYSIHFAALPLSISQSAANSVLLRANLTASSFGLITIMIAYMSTIQNWNASILFIAAVTVMYTRRFHWRTRTDKCYRCC